MVLGGRPMRDSIAVFCQVRSPVTADVPLSERGVLGGPNTGARQRKKVFDPKTA